jgi:predicted RNase H-like nuclease
MPHRKKSREGKAERLELLHIVFPAIREHILCRPPRVGVDDLLDAAAAAWSALRIHKGTAQCVCSPERDERGLEVTIRY